MVNFKLILDIVMLMDWKNFVNERCLLLFGVLMGIRVLCIVLMLIGKLVMWEYFSMVLFVNLLLYGNFIVWGFKVIVMLMILYLFFYSFVYIVKVIDNGLKFFIDIKFECYYDF